MKILIVSEYYPPITQGGGEINVATIAENLSSLTNTEVTVLTSYQNGLRRHEEQNGVKIIRRLKTGKKPESFWSNAYRAFWLEKSVSLESRRLLQKESYDVIHFFGRAIAASYQLHTLPIPLIATVESYLSLCPKGDRMYHGKTECKIKCNAQSFLRCQSKSNEIGKMKNKFYLKYNPLFLLSVYLKYQKMNRSLQYCHLISISRYMQKVLQQFRYESTVIPNSIESTNKTINQNQRKDNTQIKSEQKKNKPLKILYLGSLTEFKGAQILIDALEGLNVECTLYGSGPLKQQLQENIHKKRIAATIREPVAYSQIADIYQQNDIVIFPSIWPEPFGRIAMEAMSAGKPIIGSDTGGIREIITKDCGLLVSPGDSHELHKAIKALCEDADLREKLGANGRIIAQKYAHEKVMKDLLGVYTTAIEKNRKSSG